METKYIMFVIILLGFVAVIVWGYVAIMEKAKLFNSLATRLESLMRKEVPIARCIKIYNELCGLSYYSGSDLKLQEYKKIIEEKYNLTFKHD